MYMSASTKVVLWIVGLALALSIVYYNFKNTRTIQLELSQISINK